MTLDELNQYRSLSSEIAELESRIESDHDKKILKERLKRARELKTRIERYIQACDDSMVRQILTRRFIKGDNWAKISCDISNGFLPIDTIRNMMYRYIRNNQNTF